MTAQPVSLLYHSSNDFFWDIVIGLMVKENVPPITFIPHETIWKAIESMINWSETPFLKISDM